MAYATIIRAVVTPKTHAPYLASFPCTVDSRSQRDLVAKAFGHSAFVEAETNDDGISFPANLVAGLKLDEALLTINGVEVSNHVFSSLAAARDEIAQAIAQGCAVQTFVCVE
jgi:hypothetical protein